MPRLLVFVSHASADLAAAQEVSRWLTAAGHEVFLDQDPDAGIAVGDAWEERLHARLRRADAMLCLVSRAYVQSAWCAAEVAVARSRGSRLLPVRAEAGVDHPLLPAIQYADLAADVAGARAHVLGALRRLLVTGRRGWPEERSPFPGLRAFEPDEHLAFFGRERDVERLAATLRSPVERAKREVLVVVGPSGCGKSSTVRAGLAPTMAAEEGWWVLPPLVPGNDPVDALAGALTVAAGHARLGWTLGGLRAGLERDGLARVARELLLADPTHPRRHLLVVVDQLEQLVTVTPPAERTRFARLLAGGLEGQVRVVATLRPEFLAPLLADPALAALRTTIEPLAPLGRDALRVVVEGPAQLWGLTVPEELLARLVDDTGGGAALPLLAFTLARLTEHAGRGATLTLAAYEALGGVEGALQAQSDAALGEAMAHSGLAREAVLTALLTLVTVDPQGRPTARQRPVDELPGGVVAAFVGRRLLVTATGPDGRPLVGIAHETFLTAWPPLRDAIAAAATGLRARGTVEAAARDWDEAGRTSARLWQKGQLSAATADVGARVVGPGGGRPLRWLPGRTRTLVTDRVELDGRSREFLAASIRRDRFLRSRLVAVLTALLLVVGTLAGVAVSRGSRLDHELTTATAQLLATASTARAVDDPAFATKEALAAWHADPGSPAARDALSRQYLALQSLERVVPNPTDRPVLDIAALDPAGHTIALLGEQSTVTIVTDLLGPTPDAWTVPAMGPRSQLAVSPDGRWLAAVAPDGALDLWDVPARSGPVRLAAPAAGPTPRGLERGLAYSTDSTRLLAVRPSGNAPQIAMWDLTTRAALPVAPGLVDGSVAAIFGTPDPTQVLITSATDAIGEHRKIVTRSLTDGSVRHVFASGAADDLSAEVVQRGRAVAVCLGSGADPPNGRSLVAADTGKELRRLAFSTFCGNATQTGDSGHIVDPETGYTDVGYQAVRLVDIDTGGAVDTTLPPGRFTDASRGDQTVTVLTPPGAPPTVLVLRGSSILQLRTTPDPVVPGYNVGRTYLTEDGRSIVRVLGGEVTAVDATTGAVQGHLADPRRTENDFVNVSVADDLLMLSRIAGRWRIATFGLPALEPRETYDISPGENLDGADDPSILGDDASLVTFFGGELAQWDRKTRQQVGPPVTVGDDPDEQKAFHAAQARSRPGHPDEVVLVAPDHPVLRFGLTPRRVVGRIPVAGATNEVAFDPTGARLAVLTQAHTVEVWDADKAVRVGEPLFTPDATRLLGFTGDGYLATTGEKNQLELWDLGRGARSGVMALSSGVTPTTALRVDPLLLTNLGAVPTRIPLTAQVWVDRLCGALGPYTDAERRVLPAGTEDRQPCP